MDKRSRTVNGNVLPLRFKRHDFEAHCYNTQACSVVYDNHGFTHSYERASAPAPLGPDYRENWGFASYIGVQNFPSSAQLKWISLDGARHEAEVDVGRIFKDEIALHRIPDEELPDGMFKQGLIGGPSIFVEVNDRTVSVYFKALIPTKSEQMAGNRYSTGRDDLFLVFTRSY
ncbi:hypothetical protein [Stenotrophomonas sp. YIM B06876]|uniref:hypothetical protein n=1 Tax=Stenotrophomonas sp. YIM B06876 TaxID=3060211 RepID=UPI0027393B09|nr:hypothetical protein [Stenotrophomonas sp. YIM B06876]